MAPASKTNAEFLVTKFKLRICELNIRLRTNSRLIIGIQTFDTRNDILEEIKQLRKKITFYKNYYKKGE